MIMNNIRMEDVSLFEDFKEGINFKKAFKKATSSVKS